VHLDTGMGGLHTGYWVRFPVLRLVLRLEGAMTRLLVLVAGFRVGAAGGVGALTRLEAKRTRLRRGGTKGGLGCGSSMDWCGDRV